MPATIEVICGPMFSGKTEELVRRIMRNRYARKRELIIKPIEDTRTNDFITPRTIGEDGRETPTAPLPATAIGTALDLITLLEERRPHLLAIDEAQFFGIWLPEMVAMIRDKNDAPDVRIIIAGLDMDYRRKPFGPMPELMAIADTVTKLSGVCMKCGADNARFTHLIRGTTAQIQVGSREMYAVRCRACHLIP